MNAVDWDICWFIILIMEYSDIEISWYCMNNQLFTWWLINLIINDTIEHLDIPDIIDGLNIKIVNTSGKETIRWTFEDKYIV